jgi:hypothetical protein
MKKKLQPRPPEGSAGAHSERREPRQSSEDTEDDPVGEGAEVAPTAKAAGDQRARHAREGSSERIAARVPGKQGNARPNGLTRKQ